MLNFVDTKPARLSYFVLSIKFFHIFIEDIADGFLINANLIRNTSKGFFREFFEMYSTRRLVAERFSCIISSGSANVFGHDLQE